MNSLCDEICLTAEDGRIRFHLKPKAEDFIRAKRGFHRATHDFINITRVRNLIANLEKYLFRSLCTKKNDHHRVVVFLSFGCGIEDSHHSAARSKARGIAARI